MSTGMALCVGLNSFDPKHYAGWEGSYNACQADAIDMASIAESRKFSTKVLIAKEATRSNVIDEISKASASLMAGDIFMMTYSGIGGDLSDKNQVTDTAILNTWCLCDCQLIEYELYSLLARFQKGVRILIFSDFCRSGTVSRDLYYTTKARAEYKFLPLERAALTYRQNRAFYDKMILGLKNSTEAIEASVLLFFGCQDNQMSLDGDFNGLFTSHLLKVWKNGAFKGDYMKFHRSIVNRMPPDQVPNFQPMGIVNKKFEAQRPFTI